MIYTVKRMTSKKPPAISWKLLKDELKQKGEWLEAYKESNARLVAKLGTMKLFVFRPDGHGEQTLMVVAPDEETARKNVTDYINNNGYMAFQARSWGTDYYIMEVYEVGQVAENDNS